MAARRYRGAWLNSGRIHRGNPCRNGFLPAGGASSREAGESLVGVEYRIVFHPKAEAELEQLYGDIAGRASPAIAWKFIAGIPTIVAVCRLFHSGAPSGSRSCLAADCWLPRQHCLCRRGRVLILAAFTPAGTSHRNCSRTGPKRRFGGELLCSPPGATGAMAHISASSSGRITGMVSARTPPTIQPSQLMNFGPVDISTRNRKNIVDVC